MENESWLGFWLTVTGFILAHVFSEVPPLSTFTAAMGFLVGAVTLFIQWPNVKKRVRSIINKLKR